MYSPSKMSGFCIFEKPCMVHSIAKSKPKKPNFEKSYLENRNTLKEKKKAVKLLHHKSIEQNESRVVDKLAQQHTEKNLLKIAPALPLQDRRSLYVRSHSTLNPTSIQKAQDVEPFEFATLQTNVDGFVVVSRTQTEKEKHPDRISLDRRGLTRVPVIEDEPSLRLLSLQHNLVSDLDSLSKQIFPTLVFLDMYDNQLQQIRALEFLENLRVLLMGKNRIRKIEGLENLKKLEVLDLHGNLIGNVAGLSNLNDLKVLNLAGNQIRIVGAKDLQGLCSLQELNLRRNRLKKLLGFSDTPNLTKLFVSNNDIHSVEDVSSIAKALNIKEIAIDNNPVSLAGDCVSFFVSYLPYLVKLNNIQITEQVRKAAMAWRRNKEATNAAFMDLTSETSANYRREEVISNARTNWELLRSQTKCLTNNVTSVDKTLKNLKPDSDFILTSLTKPKQMPRTPSKSKIFARSNSKVPILPGKKLAMIRSNSQETENSQNTSNTSSSNASNNDLLKLPPILVPIINKLEHNESGVNPSGSLSSISPNVDSSISSMASESDTTAHSSPTSSSSSHCDSESEDNENKMDGRPLGNEKTSPLPDSQQHSESDSLFNLRCNANSNSTPEETCSNLSTTTNASTSTISAVVSTNDNSSTKSSTSNRPIRSALSGRCALVKGNQPRASTAKVKKTASPVMPKDREQGGDYLIEICGRFLNVYGQGALRFIDKPWSIAKAHDVTTIKFNYVNFNSVTGFLGKVKHRFPNADHFVFKETNITCIGQLNALAEVQGLVGLTIDSEGNAICDKNWQSYAVYRLAHWGLKNINGLDISEASIKSANEEYKSLSELVLWSLPDILLQPLLTRLRIDVNHGVNEQNAKKWFLAADPELRSVVSKEALQWKKGAVSQDDILMRQKAKQHISGLLEEMSSGMDKLKILDQEWPTIMHDFVQNTLLDYSQLDMYMKQKIQELNK